MDYLDDDSRGILRESRKLNQQLAGLEFAKEQIEIIRAERITPLNAKLAVLAGNKNMPAMAAESSAETTGKFLAYAQRATEASIVETAQAVYNKIKEFVQRLIKYAKEYFGSASYRSTTASIDEALANYGRGVDPSMAAKWKRKDFKDVTANQLNRNEGQMSLTRQWAAQIVDKILKDGSTLTTNEVTGMRGEIVKMTHDNKLSVETVSDYYHLVEECITALKEGVTAFNAGTDYNFSNALVNKFIIGEGSSASHVLNRADTFSGNVEVDTLDRTDAKIIAQARAAVPDMIKRITEATKAVTEGGNEANVAVKGAKDIMELAKAVLGFTTTIEKGTTEYILGSYEITSAMLYKSKGQVATEGFKEVMSAVGKKLLELLKWIQNYILEFFKSTKYRSTAASVEEAIRHYNQGKVDPSLASAWSRKGFSRKLGDDESRHDNIHHGDIYSLNRTTRTWAFKAVNAIFNDESTDGLMTLPSTWIPVGLISPDLSTITASSFLHFADLLHQDILKLSSCADLIIKNNQGYVKLGIYGSFEIDANGRLNIKGSESFSAGTERGGSLNVTEASSEMSQLGTSFKNGKKTLDLINQIATHVANDYNSLPKDPQDADAANKAANLLELSVLTDKYMKMTVGFYKLLGDYIVGSYEIFAAQKTKQGK